MTDYTEREVRAAAKTCGSGIVNEMLTQLADMLAEQDMAHDLIKTGDPDTHPAICDANGDVVLAYCRRCHQGEGDLQDKCPAAQPRVDAALRLIAEMRAQTPRDSGVSYVSKEQLDALEHMLAAQPRVPECQHEWVSGDNQYVKNAEVCLKCNTIRAAKESGR